MSSELSRELDAIVHHPDGSSEMVLAAVSDGDDCDCSDCAELAALDWQRQRFIARLKSRMLALGGHLCDELHPWGRCTCGAAGACSWCESTCLDCGGVPHEGECPELPDVVAGLPPALTELGALE